MGAAPQTPPCESMALGLAHALGVGLPFASSRLGPLALHTKNAVVFRFVGGTMRAEIRYGELSAFHSNRQAKTLEPGDRH